MGIVWLIICWFVVSDTPAESRFVSFEEKEFLESSLTTTKTKRNTVIPWRSIFSSPPVYACVFANFTMYFCTTIVLHFLPIYFKEELNLPLKQNGMYSIAPFVGQIISKNVLSIMADRIKQEKWMSNTATVKIFQSMASIGTAIVLLLLAILPSCDNPSIAVALLFAYGILYAAGIPGFFTSMLVIAPSYTGTISSFSMVAAQLGSAVAPNIVSVIAYLGLPYKWSIVFGIAASLQILSGVFFIIFGSGDEAQWAKSIGEEKEDPEKKALNHSIMKE
ncbi:hypothetical protein PRIPAC_76954 [Pristionchus pacificus]|nr:hypothetical protein PRIPAC_76954 [Pristionchus pacificus]